MNRKLLMTLAAALLSSFSVSHADAAGGLYVGAGVGQATIKADTSSGNFDASDAAYKAFVGYRFNLTPPIIDLAAEAGYTDFGKPSESVGGQNLQFKLHGWDAAGSLIFPLGPLDFYGKVGVLSWSARCERGGDVVEQDRDRPVLRRAASGSRSGRSESAANTSSTRSRTSIACRCTR